MNITHTNLLNINKNVVNAHVFTSVFNNVFPKYGITTPNRMAMFLAQTMLESNGFKSLKENLKYSDPARIAQIFRSGFDLNRDKIIQPSEIEFAKQYVRNPTKLADRAYANRLGNGDEASGDGSKFLGRGLMQLTGRNNYTAFSRWAKNPEIITNPSLVETPEYAVLSALWFWDTNKLNNFADHDDIVGCTKVINGPACLGLEERRVFYLAGVSEFMD